MSEQSRRQIDSNELYAFSGRSIFFVDRRAKILTKSTIDERGTNVELFRCIVNADLDSVRSVKPTSNEQLICLVGIDQLNFVELPLNHCCQHLLSVSVDPSMRIELPQTPKDLILVDDRRFFVVTKTNELFFFDLNVTSRRFAANLLDRCPTDIEVFPLVDESNGLDVLSVIIRSNDEFWLRVVDLSSDASKRFDNRLTQLIDSLNLFVRSFRRIKFQPEIGRQSEHKLRFDVALPIKSRRNESRRALFIEKREKEARIYLILRREDSSALFFLLEKIDLKPMIGLGSIRMFFYDEPSSSCWLVDTSSNLFKFRSQQNFQSSNKQFSRRFDLFRVNELSRFLVEEMSIVETSTTKRRRLILVGKEVDSPGKVRFSMSVVGRVELSRSL